MLPALRLRIGGDDANLPETELIVRGVPVGAALTVEPTPCTASRSSEGGTEGAAYEELPVLATVSALDDRRAGAPTAGRTLAEPVGALDDRTVLLDDAGTGGWVSPRLLPCCPWNPPIRECAPGA